MYQRKKKEENRSILQETLKRDFIKERNYLIFQLKEGEDRCSYEAIGEILDNLGLTAADVVSIAENPYNDREMEVLLILFVNSLVVGVTFWSPIKLYIVQLIHCTTCKTLGHPIQKI